MSLASNWINKIDNVDDILAEDINLLASEIIEVENDIKTADEKIKKQSEIIEDLSKVPICVKTEGESININDSADLPMKGLRVLGKTKQLKSTGKNMIPFPYHDYKKGAGVVEINGITFTINEDGTILVNGTATAETSFFLYRNYDLPSTLPLPVGTYAINSFSTDSGMIFQAAIRYNNGRKTIYKQSKSNISITSDMPDASTMSIRIVVYSGRTINNEVVYPMFSSGSAYPDYEPPTNGIPSPSPELPQPMKTAGIDGNIYVEISNGDGSKRQTLSMNTPNGLPGVPVYPDFDGNIPEEAFTDTDGNSWICDEIDLEKGVYIKRVDEYELNIHSLDSSDGNVALCYPPFEISANQGGLWEYGQSLGDAVVNDLFSIGTYNERGEETEPFIFVTSIDEEINSTLTLEKCKERYNGSKMLLILKEPIEIPLSDEVIAEYKRIHTYKPTTNISNDDGAYLRAEYIADTKSYIDNKFAELQTAMLNNI